MRGLRLPANSARWLAFVGAAAMLSACQDGPDSGAGPRSELPPASGSEDDSDQPIRVAYLCGNRFLVMNAYSVPVTLTYRVAGTEEEGSLDLTAAPAEDPAFSEAMLETRRRGTVELFLDGRRVRVRDNGAVPCTPSTPAPALMAASAEAGAWSGSFSWPIVAVHLHLLPNGRVLSWGKHGVPQVWNPANNSFTPSPSPDLLFCSGHSFLADGRLHVAGGHIDDDRGLPDVNLYSASGTWTGASPMQRGRWYPTNTTMANGEVVIIAGRDQAGLNVPLPEVWTSGSLRALTGASLNLPYYPRAFLAPNGKLFYAGEHQTTRYLDIAGAGKWTTVGQRRYANREYGSAVMYLQGKVLYAGGGRTTNTAEVIDLTAPAPAWQWTGSMAYARRQHNLTMLPTGEVLATGGVGGTAFNDLTQPVRAAEVWNPTTGTWKALASNAVVRGYHGTSILLPDGRVLHAGSGDGAGTPAQRNAELFSPPYLFLGPRPTISSAPSVAR